MKHIDTLIVGFGLAGLAYAETLSQARESFHVIDADSSGSSHIAAGIYNPTVLKRFNMTWRGQELHAFALPFYQRIAERLNCQFDYPLPIYKVFSQLVDHNQWTVATDREGLSFFLDPNLHKTDLLGVKSPLGYGVVRHCGRLDTQKLLATYKSNIHAHITHAKFDYTALDFTPNGISYQDIKAKRIVFCEGYGMVQNPFFNHLPLVGSKGQILIIKSPELKLEAIIKGAIFIVPLGNDLYWVGATFEQQDKSLICTPEGKNELVEKIDRLLNVPYEIVDQLSQIRPTVVDRRPLIGTHPVHNNMHLLNGMGSRGVLIAPSISKWLYNHIRLGDALPLEVDINRFESR